MLKAILPLFLLFLLLLSCKKTSYPCPSYNSKMSMSMDSTGGLTGGYRADKDKKTGLIKRKKDKNLYDRKH